MSFLSEGEFNQLLKATECDEELAREQKESEDEEEALGEMLRAMEGVVNEREVEQLLKALQNDE